MLHELRRFRLEFGKDAPAFKWRDPNADFSNQLSKWFYQQPDMFKQRLLTPDQARPAPRPYIVNPKPLSKKEWI